LSPEEKGDMPSMTESSVHHSVSSVAPTTKEIPTPHIPGTNVTFGGGLGGGLGVGTGGLGGGMPGGPLGSGGLYPGMSGVSPSNQMSGFGGMPGLPNHSQAMGLGLGHGASMSMGQLPLGAQFPGRKLMLCIVMEYVVSDSLCDLLIILSLLQVTFYLRIDNLGMNIGGMGLPPSTVMGRSAVTGAHPPGAPFVPHPTTSASSDLTVNSNLNLVGTSGVMSSYSPSSTNIMSTAALPPTSSSLPIQPGLTSPTSAGAAGAMKTAPQQMQQQHAISYVTTIRNRFANEPETYRYVRLVSP
jgi:hypothetical protein